MVQRKDNSEQRVFRKFMHIVLNFKQGDYYLQNLKELHANPSKQAIQQTADGILAFMRKYRIPDHWFEAFARMHARSEAIPPDHETLCLKVGDMYIYSKTYDENKVKKYAGLPLCIAITGKTTKTEIRQFVNKHDKTIQAISKLLELPKLHIRTGSSWDKNLLASLYKESGLSTKKVTGYVDPNLPNDDVGQSRNKKRVRRERKNRDIL